MYIYTHTYSFLFLWQLIKKFIFSSLCLVFYEQITFDIKTSLQRKQ